MNVAVADRESGVVVAGLRELARWPMHGLLGAIAWRFDGARLTLVHISWRRPQA